MKTIILTFLFLFTCNICNSQHKHKGFIVINIKTIGNDDYYYQSSLFLNYITKQKKVDSIPLINSNTFVMRINKKDLDIDFLPPYFNGSLHIKVQTSLNSYLIGLGSLEDLLSFKDTITYYLFYDDLPYKKEELENEALRKEKEASRIEKLEKEEIKLNQSELIRETLIREAEQTTEYYRNKINGKSHNKIADYLYHEGFSRDFSSSGSVIKEIFTLRYIYENYSQFDMSYQIKIAMWYSYGYGDLYFDVSYNYYIFGKFYNQ